MPHDVIRADVAVVGAGTAGANAAYQLARQGRSVVLVEQRALDAGGAQWHNGVLDRQFARAGLEPPVPPERIDGRRVMHLFGPTGARGVTVSGTPMVTADMTRLGRRLRDLAAGAGATLFEHATDLAVELRDGRITALDGRLTPVGSPARAARIEAALFVDASGRRGVLRRESPALARWCPTVQRDELCSAADFHLRIDDPDGAKRFLDRHDAGPGEHVTVVGTNGGFSTRAIAVGPDLDRVGVLVGCLANGRYGTGPGMLDQVRAREPWIGEPISGGFGVIPLRRPYARFTAPGLALVGDAACQVFPAHGSGIGVGLVAGRILAEAVGDAADPGDEAALWRYQAAFQHELGGTLAAYDGIRRMSTALGAGGVAAMVDAGLMDESMTRAGLDQVWAAPAAAQLAGMAARMARRPGLAAAMVPRLVRSRLVAPMGRRHPATVDERALARWDRRVERLLGPLPS